MSNKSSRLVEYVEGLLRQTKTAFEKDEIVRTAILALIALAVAYLAALGINVKLPHFGEVWEWVLGLWIVLLFTVIAPYRLWIEVSKKLETLEEHSRPKLSVSEPILTVEPKGAAGKDACAREWRLKITNHSTTLVRNCYAKQASLINRNEHESDVLGIHFKLNTDQPEIIQSYEHRQSFDLPPGGHEIVSICGTNANVDANQQMVIMLYAIHGVGGQGIRNAIPRQFFPHMLLLQICADNIAHPVERKYRLFFDEEGLFQMQHISANA